MKFRHKATEVEAVQWTGLNLQDVRLLMNSGGIDATPMGFIYFWGAGGLNATRPGDWIVKLANGDFCLCEDAEFREQYEPVVEAEKCVWVGPPRGLSGSWESDCGVSIDLSINDYHHTPSQRGYKYCYKCGREIEEKK